MNESQKEAQKRYMTKTKTYNLRLNKEKDYDIIEFLNNQKNKTEFIKQLIKSHISSIN